jgi:hypothetical protein
LGFIVWGLGAVLSFAATWRVSNGGEFERDIESSLRRTWLTLAVTDVMFLWLGLLEDPAWLLGAGGVLPLGFVARTLQLALVQARNLQLWRAYIGYTIAGVYGPLLLILAFVTLSTPLRADVLFAVATLLFFVYPLAAALGSWFLVGTSHPPLQFRPPALVAPQRVLNAAGHPYRAVGELQRPSLRRHRATVVVSALLAAATLTTTLSQQWVKCDGALRAASAPAGWQQLPVIAHGQDTSLGPFKFHALHSDFWRSVYRDAALGDAKLCFADTISLSAWFDPSPERSPRDLALRYDAATGVYVVTGTDRARSSYGPSVSSVVRPKENDRFVTAFRRELSPRRALIDPDLGILLWPALGLLGAGFAFAPLSLFPRRSRDPHTKPSKVPVLFFTLATLLCVAVWIYWTNSDVPRPGREVVTLNQLW